MDYVTIGGTQYPIKLKMCEVDKFMRLFNKYYDYESVKIHLKHDTELFEINELEDNSKEKKKRMYDFISRMSDEMENIIVPTFFMFDILYKILDVNEKKKKPFKSKRKMIKEILTEEYQDLVTLIGSKVLNLDGYESEKK